MQSQFTLLPFDDERFWAKVDFNGPVPAHHPELGSCWLWVGNCDDGGYGRLRRQNLPRKAHRYCFEHTHGAIPDGLLVCHHCDTPPCVNPQHHFLGTHLDNARDAFNKGRHSTQRADFTSLIRAGISHRVSPSVCGELNPQSKITADIVRDIRRRYVRRVVTAQTLADEYGLSRSHVSDIILRKRWADLPD